MIDLLEMKEWHESRKRASGGSRMAAVPALPVSSNDTDESEGNDLQPLGNEYIPTPEAIRHRCLEIQAGWTASERRRRSSGSSRCKPEVTRVHRLWAPAPECA